MKSRFIVEIVTPDTLSLFPEDGQTDEDFQGEKQKELQEFRKEYALELHKAIVKAIDTLNEDNFFDDLVFDNDLFDEVQVEGWDTLKDYGVEVKIKKLVG